MHNFCYNRLYILPLAGGSKQRYTGTILLQGGEVCETVARVCAAFGV